MSEHGKPPTARMEAVREALRFAVTVPLEVRWEKRLAAALAEVEEWEARLRDAESITYSGLVTRLMQRAEAAEARADTLEAALNVIDRRADDALAALFGIADNNEARPRVARALTAIQQIREALTPDEPSAFPEEGCVCMECEAARAALASADGAADSKERVVGENLAARVQQARKILLGGNPNAMIAYLLGVDESVVRQVAADSKDTA